MASTIEIEDIEELRRQQGIDDVELRAAIRGLKIGDIVNLTFLSNPRAFQSVPVKITHIRGNAFRGKLIKSASRMGRGKIVDFAAAHVHSVVHRAVVSM